MPHARTHPALEGSLEDLYRRPGFMIRRAHQIAVAIFLEEARESRITTTQYGVLVILRRRPGIDQNTLGRLLGLDRSTAGLVVRKLAERELIARAMGAGDLRRRELRLTPAGVALLGRVSKDARRAQQRLLSPLPARERARFLDLLSRLTEAFNRTTRVPVDYAAGIGRR
ncbi:MAG TPA: MarR family transcriptional regulator [Stellaceae bacterium]|nr:MarR family transcriptional regulator [Stellaceae bacterium]